MATWADIIREIDEVVILYVNMRAWINFDDARSAQIRRRRFGRMWDIIRGKRRRQFPVF